MLLETFVAMYSSTSSGTSRRSDYEPFAKDRDAGLEVGRLHVGDETPLEASAHAVFETGEGGEVSLVIDLLVVVVQVNV